MKVLLDNMLDVRLVDSCPSYELQHVRQLGWQSKSNGSLVKEADQSFQVLVTMDKNMPFQTSLKNLRLSVVVLDLPINDFETAGPEIRALAGLLDKLAPGNFYSFREGKLELY